MKRIRGIILIFLLFVAPLFAGKAGAFFSYSTAAGGGAQTAKLSAEITDLTVFSEDFDFEGEGVLGAGEVWTEENSFEGAYIRVNHGNVFSFLIKNTGTCDLDYHLDIELSWQGTLPESGNILLYPTHFSDEYIMHKIAEGDSADALVWLTAADTTLLDGNRLGIKTTVASSVLSADAATDNPANYIIYEDRYDNIYEENLGGNYAVLGSAPFMDYQNQGENEIESQKKYSFKVFFFESAEIFDNPLPFHHNDLHVEIVLSGGISGRETGWTVGQKSSFKLDSIVDTVVPTLTELPHADTYYITQAGNVDLTSFVSAHDRIEGDLSANIIITSQPEFNPQAAGEYKITYNAANSFGNQAVPLTLTITVWDFAKITSGNYHTLALTTHGKVYSWGYNGFGQQGDGTLDERPVPYLVDLPEKIVDVAAGMGSSFALTTDGRLYAWGRGENGRLGDGSTTNRLSPVLVSQGNLRFVSVSARYASAGAVTDTGDVYTWGYGGYGTLGTGATADRNVPTKIDLSNIASLEMGYYNGAAVTNDGQVYTWGDNLNGQLGRGTTGGTTAAPALVSSLSTVEIKQLSVGWYHMTAVSSAGDLYTWGYGAEGRLGNGGTTIKNTPQLIPMPASVTKALAGYYHTGALTEDGRVYFFGQNAYGKHGTGNVTNHLTPTLLPLARDFVDLSLGMDSSFVLTSAVDGGTVVGRQVYGMGYGLTGVLGTGINDNSTMPVLWAFTPPPAA